MEIRMHTFPIEPTPVRRLVAIIIKWMKNKAHIQKNKDEFEFLH